MIPSEEAEKNVISIPAYPRRCRWKGTLAKAKANATQGIPELLEMAVNKRFLENRDSRHIRNAQYGWYRYDILDIKKKRATLSAHNELTRHKTHFSSKKDYHEVCAVSRKF